MEGHCEPSLLYKNPTKTLRGLDFNTTKQQMFEAYVDTMPLKWNLRFLPQSLYFNDICRVLNGYDFTWKMGPDFWTNVRTVAER